MTKREMRTGKTPGGGAYAGVFGGANMDVQGFPHRALILRDSNPGRVLLSAGGVGRNIAENVARLGLPVKLFTLLGDDLYGGQIRLESRRAGVDMSCAETVPGESTGTYLCILDERGDMYLAVSHMDICDRMDGAYISRKQAAMAGSAVMALDTNPPEQALRRLVTALPGMKFIADLVSVTKAEKLRPLLGHLHTVKPNRLEARVLTGVEITGRASLDRAADLLLARGVKNVFITLGAEGAFYCDERTRGVVRLGPIVPANATGAGDAFAAGLVLGTVRNWPIEQKARFAAGAALMALDCPATINPHLSEEAVLQIIGKAEETCT